MIFLLPFAILVVVGLWKFNYEEKNVQFVSMLAHLSNLVGNTLPSRPFIGHANCRAAGS